MERSLRCFTFGLLGLVPVLGAPFSVLSVILHFRVRFLTGAGWNPAEPYVVWGFILATWGLGQSLMTFGWVVTACLE